MELKYEITQISKKEHSVQIEDEEFISITHWRDGKSMFTAFIGKGEGNNNKLSITLSTMGGVLEIKGIAGSCDTHAILLLKQDSRNKIIKNEIFKHWYRLAKKYLLIEL